MTHNEISNVANMAQTTFSGLSAFNLAFVPPLRCLRDFGAAGDGEADFRAADDFDPVLCRFVLAGFVCATHFEGVHLQPGQ